MKKHNCFAIIIILVCSFLLSAYDGQMTGDYKYFERKLWGTWVSNDSGLYSGTLIITYDTIAIDGYGEDWTSMVGDDSKRPFRNLPRRKDIKGYSERVSLNEYSEEGKIFIEYGDTAEDGIPYIYTEGGKYPQKYKLLEFIFGGRKEILEFQTDY